MWRYCLIVGEKRNVRWPVYSRSIVDSSAFRYVDVDQLSASVSSEIYAIAREQVTDQICECGVDAYFLSGTDVSSSSQ